MKMSKEKQKEMLLETFEILNENYYENRVEIKDIVGKMFKHDIATAIEMWSFLLKKHPKMVKDQDTAYQLTDGIIYNANEVIGSPEVADIVLTNAFIKKNVFELSGDVSYNTVGIVAMKIESNELFVANELLELIDRNKYKEWSLYNVIDSAIPSGDEISEEAFELLMRWIDKIENKQEKAKLNLKMMRFMEE